MKQPSTVVRPFTLRSAAKHDDAVAQLAAARQAAATSRLQEATQFKARALPPSTYSKPAPVIASKPTVGNENLPPSATPVVLRSDLRAAKRREFDQLTAQKMVVAAEEKQRRALMDLAAEQQDIANIRRKSVAEGGMMFKASSVQKEDRYPTKVTSASGSSKKELTEPKSPYLRTKVRAGFSASTGAGGWSADMRQQQLFTEALNNV
jgi:hypothetical protein